MATNFVQKAIDCACQATELDKANKYEEALEMYQRAIEFFILAVKNTNRDETRKALREKIRMYLERAESINTIIFEQNKSSIKQYDKTKETKEIIEKDDPETAALQATLMGSIVIEKPNVKWSDISGLDEAKSILQETVILPIKFPQLFTGKRKPWSGILLYGPPGTGKSYLAKAVATEANGSTFISVSSSDLVSKWQGQSERLIKALFDMARENKPCIIFIDEVDSMCSARSDSESESSRRIKTEFLVQMQGINGNGSNNDGVLVLGATNIPWSLDPGIRRRFEKRIYIPLPERDARILMLKNNVGLIANTLTNNDYMELGIQTKNYSGADISVLVRDALMEPVRKIQSATHFKKIIEKDKTKDKPKDNIYWISCSPGDKDAEEKHWSEIKPEEIKETHVTFYDMLRALKRTKPSVCEEDLDQFMKWTIEFGQDG